MIVLGLNINHGDTAACLIKNGKLIAAVEQERFVRKKHSSDFPMEAIIFCLKEARIDIENVNYITVNSNFKYNIINNTCELLINSVNLFHIRFDITGIIGNSGLTLSSL